MKRYERYVRCTRCERWIERTLIEKDQIKCSECKTPFKQTPTCRRYKNNYIKIRY